MILLVFHIIIIKFAILSSKQIECIIWELFKFSPGRRHYGLWQALKNVTGVRDHLDYKFAVCAFSSPAQQCDARRSYKKPRIHIYFYLLNEQIPRKVLCWYLRALSPAARLFLSWSNLFYIYNCEVCCFAVGIFFSGTWHAERIIYKKLCELTNWRRSRPQPPMQWRARPPDLGHSA